MNNTRGKVVSVFLSLIFVFTLACVSLDYITTVTVVPTPSAVESATTVAETENYYSAYFTSPPLDYGTPGIEANLISLIENAKVSVHGAFFEMDLPNLADALVSAAARGIDVKLVYDNEQVNKPERVQIISELTDAGIPLVPDERSAFMHNKFFVIDGNIVWTGSFNYTENASHRNNENAVIFFVPELAQNYEREFAEMFAGKFGPTSTSDTPFPQISLDGITIANYFGPEDEVMAKVIAAVGGAKESVDFLSFSFTDVDLAYTMSELALNDDLTVQGVFESSQSTGYSVCSYLQERGKNIEGNGKIVVKLDSNPRNMHEKVIVIDDRIVIFGSFNFSTNADTSNDENLLIIDDPNLASLFVQEFQKIFETAIVPLDGCKKP
jgi:phosphatidylserine/phosphatidylglycerophosphate/cardiolipin synthase-like enzyme